MTDLQVMGRRLCKVIDERIRRLDEERVDLTRQKREIREALDEMNGSTSQSASFRFRAAQAALEEGKADR